MNGFRAFGVDFEDFPRMVFASATRLSLMSFDDKVIAWGMLSVWLIFYPAPPQRCSDCAVGLRGFSSGSRLVR